MSLATSVQEINKMTFTISKVYTNQTKQNDALNFFWQYVY